MAWGQRSQGIDDILQRLHARDPGLQSLTLMRQRKLDGATVGNSAAVARQCHMLSKACANQAAAHAGPGAAFSNRCGLDALCWCGLCVQDVHRLCTALANNPHLTELSITAHTLDTACARHVADLLSSPVSHLKTISLGNSTLGDEAMAELCRGIAANSSLTSVDAEHKVRTH